MDTRRHAHGPRLMARGGGVHDRLRGFDQVLPAAHQGASLQGVEGAVRVGEFHEPKLEFQGHYLIFSMIK